MRNDWLLWSVWFVWFLWLNQQNKPDRPDEPGRPQTKLNAERSAHLLRYTRCRGVLVKERDGSRHECHPAQGTHTARRVCRLSTRGRLLLRRFGRVVSRLLLVGVQFQLRHGVLQLSPFFRNQGEEFDTEAAHARPPHDGFEDGPSLTQEDSPSSAACLSRS